MAFSQTFIAGVDALGAVLLHFLWQGAVLGLLYALLRPACASARARYRLGMGMLLALALCPLLTIFYVWPGGAAAVTTAATSLTPASVGSIVAAADGAVANWDLREFLPWLVAAWMCGVLVIASRSLWHWQRLARLVRHAAVPLPQWDATLVQMCRRFGLWRPVRLLASAKVATPMLIGWIKPVILLPLSMLSGFSTHQIELIIAHELGHVRRRDYLANLVQVVIEVVLFYHPVVHWISRDVRNARENCCDDLVLSLAKGNPIAYARALADLEELRHDLDVVAPALGANGGVLLARIRRIVGAEGRDPLPRSNAWPVLLAVAAVVCLAMRPQHSMSDLIAPLQLGLVRSDLIQPDLIRPDVLQPNLIRRDEIQHDLVAALANVPAQSLAMISGNPQLAGSAKPAAPSPTAQVKPAALAATASVPAAAPATETAVAPNPAAPVQVRIAPPRIDNLVFAANTQVRDIAPVPALPATVALADVADPVQTAATGLPTRLRVVSPVYPQRAMSARVEGNVELQYSIAADGSVRDIQVLHAQPEGVFDAAAQAALSQWRFEPSSALGDTSARHTQNFAFTLNAGSATRPKCQQVIGSLICRHLED
jgi:TonB family protein